ncbi:MAG TPA: hypothetical protein VG675_17315 [Bryobacteraceae bacterium]|nr:hypothetical protein [Bryobacteraceae bacterium]
MSARVAIAGPPFLTDDPQPVDYQHFEIYAFSTYYRTGPDIATQGPALEVNWGAVPDVQLHLVIPMAGAFPGGGPNAFGPGDIEMGIKYRFIHETKHRPQFGVFPFIELPAGSADRGLGNGRTWYRIPLWVQKSGGPWTTYGGGGVVINPTPGMRNYDFEGWLVQRDIGDKWTLGTELFRHGAVDTDPSTRPSTLWNVGGYYYFIKPGFQLLFSLGHSVHGAPESDAYLGLYWTWGPDASKHP